MRSTYVRTQAHNSRGSSARSGEGAEQGSERLELAPPSAAYKDNSSMGSRGINHAKPSDPESETLVLGPSVLERRAAPAADAVTERIGSRSSTPHASLHSSMQSSMGSARNAAPRLLSGAAASRAPPPPLVRVCRGRGGRGGRVCREGGEKGRLCVLACVWDVHEAGLVLPDWLWIPAIVRVFTLPLRIQLWLSILMQRRLNAMTVP
eukprot:scaffold14448_cov22-Tisochrysis_lutea.AAC.2